MKKGQVLVLVIWGAMPILCAFIPAFRAWDIFVTPTFSQNTEQNPAMEKPGFWEILRSVLSKKAPESDDTKSVPEQNERVYHSIYSDEIRLYDSISRLGVSDWDRYQNIITHKCKQTELHLAPNIKVFGWHPYWMGNAYKSYNFKLLSYIAWFSYNVDPKTGSYDNPDVIDAWKQAGDLVNAAHADSCKVLITITIHTLDGNTTFLNNTKSQNNLIDSLIFLLAGRGDGVDVHFENVLNGLQEEMTVFLTNLSQKLKKANPEYVLIVDLPMYDRNKTYEIQKLDPFVDLFLVTEYGKSRKYRPIAPLDAAGGPYTIKHYVNQYLQGGLKKEKLLLGLPYYGELWNSQLPTPSAWDSTLTFNRHMTYREIKDRYRLEKPQYNLESWSGYYVRRNPDSGYYEQCWFDDSLTLRRKYDWVLQEKLAGIGIWALGNDNSYTELWGLIDNMFTVNKEVSDLEPSSKSKYYRILKSLTEYRSLIAVAGVFAVLSILGVFFYAKRTHKGLTFQVHYLKNIISREFLWLLINLVLAIPLTYLFIFYFMDVVAGGDILTANEKNWIKDMYVCVFIGLVLLRIIIMVIKKCANYVWSYIAD